MTSMSTEPSADIQSYNGTWLIGNQFYLNMEDLIAQEKAKNRKIYDNRVLFGNLCIGLIICIFLIGTNVFHELVIPIFENMSMTDQTFMIFDEVIYYLPSFGMFALLIIVIFTLYQNKEKERALCKEVISHYSQIEYKRKVALKMQERINNSSYIPNVPIVEHRYLTEAQIVIIVGAI